METETVFGVIGLVWMVASVFVMGRSIRKGRGLVDVLATRHPETYEELGRPRPSYWASARGRRFGQFLGRREFEDLDDALLSAEFEAFRKSETRLVLSVIGSGLVLGLLVFVMKLSA
jgi:hypothetical protein